MQLRGAAVMLRGVVFALTSAGGAERGQAEWLLGALLGDVFVARAREEAALCAAPKSAAHVPAVQELMP